jgi:hypothetical protein
MSERPPRAHVLLIGIDAYDGAQPLDGCVNDIDAVQRVLLDRMGIPPEHVTRLAAPRFGRANPEEVPSQPPTLENIRAAFAALCTDAVSAGDRVFVHYSGHGTQLRIRSSSGALFFREALLPKDHLRSGKRQYLFDWELNQLLAQIGSRTSCVSVVLDCCCSSGATRGSLTANRGAQSRFHPSPELVLTADALAGVAGSSRGIKYAAAASRSAIHVVAACQDDERAYEASMSVDGPRHGELTRAIVAQLDEIPNDELLDLRWGRIWRPVLEAVRRSSPAQHPWRSGGDARFVFGGPAAEGDSGYGLFRAGRHFRVDAGALAGVDKHAELAVYGPSPPIFPELGSRADHDARIGLLRIVEAESTSALAEIVAPPPADAWGLRGRLVRVGHGRLRVALRPQSPVLVEALMSSPLLELTAVQPHVSVVQRADGKWVVTDDVFGDGSSPEEEPSLAALDGAAAINACLHEYFAYSAPLRMARGAAALPGALRITVLDCNAVQRLAPAAAQNPELPEATRGQRFSYDLRVGDRVCLRLDNESTTDLWVALLVCQTSGAVRLAGEKQLRAGGFHVFWFGDELGRPFAAGLPRGIVRGVDRLVAIGTTRRDASFRSLEKSSTFGAPRQRAVPFRSTVTATEVWTSTTATLHVQ